MLLPEKIMSFEALATSATEEGPSLKRNFLCPAKGKKAPSILFTGGVGSGISSMGEEGSSSEEGHRCDGSTHPIERIIHGKPRAAFHARKGKSISRSRRTRV